MAIYGETFKYLKVWRGGEVDLSSLSNFYATNRIMLKLRSHDYLYFHQSFIFVDLIVLGAVPFILHYMICRS